LQALFAALDQKSFGRLSCASKQLSVASDDFLAQPNGRGTGNSISNGFILKKTRSTGNSTPTPIYMPGLGTPGFEASPCSIHIELPMGEQLLMQELGVLGDGNCVTHVSIRVTAAAADISGTICTLCERLPMLKQLVVVYAPGVPTYHNNDLPPGMTGVTKTGFQFTTRNNSKELVLVPLEPLQPQAPWLYKLAGSRATLPSYMPGLTHLTCCVKWDKVPSLVAACPRLRSLNLLVEFSGTMWQPGSDAITAPVAQQVVVGDALGRLHSLRSLSLGGYIAGSSTSITPVTYSPQVLLSSLQDSPVEEMTLDGPTDLKGGLQGIHYNWRHPPTALRHLHTINMGPAAAGCFLGPSLFAGCPQVVSVQVCNVCRVLDAHRLGLSWQHLVRLELSGDVELAWKGKMW
jgi:hypothetical protein